MVCNGFIRAGRAGITTDAGTATFSVASNTGDSPRSGTVIVAGQAVTVTQTSATCSYGLSFNNTTLPVSGGTLTVAVSAPSGCSWTAQSAAVWATSTSGASGTGNGTFTFNVSPNYSGEERNSTISVSGQTLYVDQLATAGPAPAPTPTVTTPTPLRFVPVTPCRIADTRDPDGTFGGPVLSGGAARAFNISGSGCNIPSTAQAFSLNATVVPSGYLGYLSIWPSGQAQPLVSTLNSTDGRVKANALIVGAGVGGSIDVVATNETHFVLDIDGYFVPANDTTGLEFYPLTPCRVLDTRSLNAPLVAMQPRDVAVQANACGAPASAQAYSLNFTSIPHGPLSYLSTWPAGQGQPLVSTLNAPTGTVVANAAIVPAGQSGDISVFATDDSDLVIDINGYFAAPGTGGLSFYQMTPCRVLDTRGTSGVFQGMLTANVVGSVCAPPASAAAFVLNATVVPPGAVGYLSLWPDSVAQPLVSTLNAEDGAITSNMAIVPTVNGSLDVYSSDRTQLFMDLFGYFAP